MGFVLENHEPQISWFKLKLVNHCFSYVLKTPRTTAVPQHILEWVTKSSEKSFTAMVLVYANFYQTQMAKKMIWPSAKPEQLVFFIREPRVKRAAGFSPLKANLHTRSSDICNG